jgi:hypothetical protein
MDAWLVSFALATNSILEATIRKTAHLATVVQLPSSSLVGALSSAIKYLESCWIALSSSNKILMFGIGVVGGMLVMRSFLRLARCVIDLVLSGCVHSLNQRFPFLHFA